MFTYVTTANHNNEFPQHLYYENCTKRMGGNEEIGTNGEKVGLPINPILLALEHWKNGSNILRIYCEKDWAKSSSKIGVTLVGIVHLNRYHNHIVQIA